MKAKALKGFLHDELGTVRKDDEFEATEAQLGAVLSFVEILDKGEPPKAEKAKAKPPAKPKAETK